MQLQPGLHLRVRAVGRQHSHTQSHTGLLMWAAALPLAQLLLRCPRTFQCAHACSLAVKSNFPGYTLLQALRSCLSASLKEISFSQHHVFEDNQVQQKFRFRLA